MKVYVLIEYDWEDNEVQAVYSDIRLAEAEKARIKARYPGSSLGIDEYELDKLPEGRPSRLTWTPRSLF